MGVSTSLSPSLLERCHLFLRVDPEQGKLSSTRAIGVSRIVGHWPATDSRAEPCRVPPRPAKSLSKILRIRRRSCPSMQGGSFDIHQVPRVGWVGKRKNSLAWRGKGHQRPIPKPRSQPRTACFSPSERAAAALGKRDQSVFMVPLPAGLCPAQNWPIAPRLASVCTLRRAAFA